MVLISHLSKQIKISKFYNLQKTHKYILFCLCYELSSDQIIFLNKQNISFCLLKKNLFKNFFKFSGKNVIMAIFIKDFNQLNQIFFKINLLKKLKPTFLLTKNKLISVLKLNKLIQLNNNNNHSLYISLQKSIFILVKLFVKISKQKN